MHFAEKAGCTFFLPGYGKKLPWGRAIFCRSQAILVMWSSVIRNKSLSVVWCSVSVVSDGVLHYCKSLYIILLWWFCVVWSRNGKVKPGRIEKRGIETKKELQVKPITLFALQDGLEPTTPWLTVRCSNQLSYWSSFALQKRDVPYLRVQKY